MAAFQIQAFGESQTGPVRSINEDSYLVLSVNEWVSVFAVADGVGGHDAGEVASQNTVALLKTGIEYIIERHPDGMSTPVAFGELDSLLRQINTKIRDLNTNSETTKRMATTLSCVWLIKERLIIGQVGDSRVYRWRAGTLKRLTVDDTEAGRLFAAGSLSEEEERIYPGRNKILQAVGIRPEYFSPTLFEETVQTGDRYLICSDGLNGGLWDKDIERLLETGRYSDSKECAEALVDMAVLNYGKDNTTAVVFDVL